MRQVLISGRHDHQSDASPTVFLKLPISVVQWTDLSGFQPSRDAVKMKGMIADTPSYRAFLICRRALICLTLNTKIHDMISTDGAVVDDNIPGPESNGIPLFHLESLFAITSTVCGSRLGCFGDSFGFGRASWTHVRHIDICHLKLERRPGSDERTKNGIGRMTEMASKTVTSLG